MSTESGSDPIGDFQRWLMKAGARSIGANVADRVKSTLGGGDAKHADVWETATTEEPGDEPPECQWCPICRAARKYREAGGTAPSAGSPLAGMGDTLAGFTRDAFGLFEAAMRPTPPRPPASYTSPSAPSPSAPSPSAPSPSAPPVTTPPVTTPPVTTPPVTTPPVTTPPVTTPPVTTPPAEAPAPAQPSDYGTVVGPGVGWPTVIHAQHEDDEAAHEGGDRQEGGEGGDGGPDGGTDEQVERTAE
jgi:hypothetical protein